MGRNVKLVFGICAFCQGMDGRSGGSGLDRRKRAFSVYMLLWFSVTVFLAAALSCVFFATVYPSSLPLILSSLSPSPVATSIPLPPSALIEGTDLALV